MNRYHKALCRDHQRSTSIRGTTKDLQDLVRERHKDELVKETPVLKTVKDWINADFETWDKVLNKKDDGSYNFKVSGVRTKEERFFVDTADEVLRKHVLKYAQEKEKTKK